MTRSSTLLLFALLLTGCAKSITTRRFSSKDIIPSGKRVRLSVDPENKDSLGILYLGCGHMVFRYENYCILTDPFFSTQPFTKRKIRSSTEALGKYQKLLAEHIVDLTKVNSVLIGHTHYDHMMDIPLLLKKELLPNGATLFGNSYGDSILTHFIKGGQYHSILQSEAYDPAGSKIVPQWLTASPSIRMMPIRSNHASHFKIGFIKVHLMKGELPPGYFKGTFKQDTSITRRKNWKEGDTYSYLVDFQKEDKIQFRVFIQTSASDFPKGSPPPEVLKEHPVDIAVLCVASANNVKPYPVDILKQLNPQKIVFIHWEDFFLKPFNFDSTKLLRSNNFRKFNKRLVKNGFDLKKEDYVMPRPGTMMTF